MAADTHFVEHPEIARRFPDLPPPMSRQAAVAEANRCLYCFDAPCMGACPTHIDVPAFIKKIASGNLIGSAEKILEANVLAASCSRVCPVEVLCEGACVLHHEDKKPIRIGLLQRHAMEAFHASGLPLPRRAAALHAARIACIGAGPASLAAAAELRQRGFNVTIFDKRPLPGGLNTYGVAEYKLTASASLREIALIEELGVVFRYGTSIESEADLAELEREFDVIFLGVGLGAMHSLPIPGGDGANVVDALRFIEEYKLGQLTEMRGSVLVVGAGNTAVDAAVAARRLGADDVGIVYRRGEKDISAFDFEYAHALQEGVRFYWQTQPVAVHPHGLECVKVDETLTPVSGSTHQLPADLVIPAIGQSPLLMFLAYCRGVAVSGGRVTIDRSTGQTSNPKYFAGGDCVNGGREVVDAVADGKRAALGMAALLEAAHA